VPKSIEKLDQTMGFPANDRSTRVVDFENMKSFVCKEDDGANLKAGLAEFTAKHNSLSAEEKQELLMIFEGEAPELISLIEQAGRGRDPER